MSSAAWLPTIQQLRVDGCRLVPAAAAVARAGEKGSSGIGGGKGGGESGLALLWGPPAAARLTALTELKLHDTGLCQEGNARGGVARLAAYRLPGLRRLDLSHMPLTATGLSRLSGAPWMSQLVRLDLSHTLIGDGGVEALCHSPLASLVDLAVGHCGGTAAALAALTEAPWVVNLRRLAIGGDGFESSEIGGGGVYYGSFQRFAAAPLDSLRELDLSGSPQVEGLKVLLQSGAAWLARLERLVVHAGHACCKKTGAVGLEACGAPALAVLRQRGALVVAERELGCCPDCRVGGWV